MQCFHSKQLKKYRFSKGKVQCQALKKQNVFDDDHIQSYCFIQGDQKQISDTVLNVDRLLKIHL